MRDSYYFSSLASIILLFAFRCAAVQADQTCTTSFDTVDRSSLWTDHPCDCFDKTPRGTKIYLVDEYEIVNGNISADLPPETAFSCTASGLTYSLPGSVQREHVPATAKVTYVRAAAEMIVTSREAQAELDRRLRAGTAVFERLR